MDLDERHRVSISLNGKPRDGFTFLFKDRGGSRLCLFYEKGYGSWKLEPTSWHTKACKCEEGELSISEEARKAEASPFSGLALVEFPGSIQVEMDVPGAYDDAGKDDARWVVPKALRFSPPSQAVLIDGSRSEFQIHATVSNPTAKPIPLVVWQVQPRLFPTEEFEAIKNFTSFEGVSWNGTFTSKAVE